MINPQSSSASKSTKFKKVFSDTEQNTKKLLFSNNNNKDKIDEDSLNKKLVNYKLKFNTKKLQKRTYN